MKSNSHGTICHLERKKQIRLLLITMMKYNIKDVGVTFSSIAGLVITYAITDKQYYLNVLLAHYNALVQCSHTVLLFG